MSRLPVKKTYKLYIGGAFPRSESGRTYLAEGAERRPRLRKDLRDAVRAARAAQPGWAGATAYNRGQVVYRIAEMLETRRAELRRARSGRDEVDARDRPLVWYAGWADKLAQVLGGDEPGRRPVLQLHDPGADRRRRRSSRPTSRRSRASSRASRPAIVGGNAVVVVASEPHPLAAVELAEVLATSDVPGGVVNLLTGQRAELAPWLAGHMDVNAIDVTGADGLAPELEKLAAENVKRVVHGTPNGQSPWEIAAFLELKTVWHPIGT